MTSTLSSVLAAREKRWARLQRLCRPGMAVISCTARMPWQLRQSPEIYAEVKALWELFLEQLSLGLLLEQGQSVQILESGWQLSEDGPEGWCAVSLPARQAKHAAIFFEGSLAGALLDIDVLDAEGQQMNREAEGSAPRTCMVCGGEARVCARNRSHPLHMLASCVSRLCCCSALGRFALRSLLEEAALPSKPGLVSPDDRGAHDDMDYPLFQKSAHALFPYFCDCACTGFGLAQKGESPTLDCIRKRGILAEQTMFRATGGVNTHKGAVFSFGIVCLCAGWLAFSGRHGDHKELSKLCARACEGLVDRELKAVSSPSTAGERLYRRFGVRGIRGEAENGFPSAFDYAFPILHREMASGRKPEQARLHTLLALMSAVEDSNILNRAGQEGLAFVRAACRDILAAGSVYTEEGNTLYESFRMACREKRISPGGCADLFALTLLLYAIASWTGSFSVHGEGVAA